MRLCHVNADRYGTDVYRLRCNAFNLQEQLNKMKSDSTSERDQLGWQMPMYAVLAAVIVFLPSLISSKTEVLYIFVIVPGLALISICVLIYAAVSRRLPTAMMVATFCVVSAVAFLYNFQIRTFTRWLLWSGQYKKEVLAEPTPVNGDLKHIEWDGWGWGGQDTTDLVRRLESHWYTVQFYTNQDWRPNC